jgi:hypothetical protein
VSSKGTLVYVFAAAAVALQRESFEAVADDDDARVGALVLAGVVGGAPVARVELDAGPAIRLQGEAFVAGADVTSVGSVDALVGAQLAGESRTDAVRPSNVGSGCGWNLGRAGLSVSNAARGHDLVALTFRASVKVIDKVIKVVAVSALCLC